MATMIIKPRKRYAFITLALIVLATLVINWKADRLIDFSSVGFLGFIWLSLPFVLIILLYTELYSGYIKLENGKLTRKSLFSTNSIKVRDIREVSVQGSGVFPTSRIGAGSINLGNAKDGYVYINVANYKKHEAMPLIKKLHSELKSVNPKRAKDLQKALLD